MGVSVTGGCSVHVLWLVESRIFIPMVCQKHWFTWCLFTLFLKFSFLPLIGSNCHLTLDMLSQDHVLCFFALCSPQEKRMPFIAFLKLCRCWHIEAQESVTHIHKTEHTLGAPFLGYFPHKSYKSASYFPASPSSIRIAKLFVFWFF